MTVYYNEINPYCAAWLRNLIAAGHLPAGDVDERSIRDVKADEIRTYTQHHFFAGIGVWSHALRLAGWADDRPIVTGSCPCQPFSESGKRLGAADERHLWPDFFRIISKLRPDVVLGEQVATEAGYGWFDGVAADLEREGYASRAFDLAACAVDAPHRRQRLYWCALADADNEFGRSNSAARHQHHGTDAGRQEDRGDDASCRGTGFWGDAERLQGPGGQTWRSKPGLQLLVDGSSIRVAQLSAFGNAIVAPLAEEFIKSVIETLDTNLEPAK